VAEGDSSGRRKALVISYHVTGPDRDSGSRRVFHLMGFLLESGWDVAFLASDGVGRTTDVLRLQALGIQVHDATRGEIGDILRAADPDLVIVAFWRNAERYLPAIRTTCPGARVLVDSVDLHFLRESRRVFAAGEESWLGLGPVQAADYARELGAYGGSDLVLTVSQKEADLVGDLLWDADRARAVPDFESIEPSAATFAGRRGMVLLGSFEHPPNVEAAAFLFGDILPLVDRSLLESHPLQVIGNGLDDRIRRMGAGHPDVAMVGWVPHVEPYLASARVSLVPLLHGAGTKRKLIQALAVGTPTVSTSIGTEGLGVADGEHVLVADDAPAFAAAIERLLTDEGLWDRLRLSGIRLISGTNGLDRARAAFVEAIESVMMRPPRRIAPLATGYRRVATRPADRAAENVTIAESVSSMLPPGSRVALVTDVEAGLLDLPGREVWAVSPEAGEVRLASDATDERVPSRASVSVARASHVVIPVRAAGLLESDRALRRTLERSFRAIHRDESFVLLESVTDERPSGTSGPLDPASIG
jgi:glycosyltransferase involved in cell wall biosynthesis